MKRLLLFIILFPFLLNGQDFPLKPSNYITDEANILNNEQEQALNAKLRGFEDSSTNQIFIYIASSLNGKDLTTYSQDIFHAWKIGQDDKNNGILITIFIDDHKFRIHTGYGLEGVLPDIATKHIQDNDMRPFFKQNQYYEGIDKGVDQLIYYSKNEFKADTAIEDESMTGLYIFSYLFGGVFLLIIILLTRKIQDRPTAKKVIIISSVLLFLIPFVGTFLLIIMLFVAISMRKDLLKPSTRNNWTSTNDSSWSNSDSSSSWSSSDSDSSSSFDGGGGGDSGGGGSSSDW